MDTDLLAQEFADRAAEGERLRTMPMDLVAKVQAAGLFAMNRPRTIGGLELDLPSQLRVLEDLAYGDGSAGWSVMTGASGLTFAWLDPDVARAMLADDRSLPVAQVLAPSGRPSRTGRASASTGGGPLPADAATQAGTSSVCGAAPRRRGASRSSRGMPCR